MRAARFSRALSVLFCAALVVGAALFPLRFAVAGSCCGGGSGAFLVVPKFGWSMVDVSFEMETYRGFWNQNGKYLPDPSGSDLRQYRVNAGYALRLGKRWQTSISVPYVWNYNRYMDRTSRTHGPGDSTLAVWYEALDDTSAWNVKSVKDLVPSVLIGPSLLIPTGVSPFDDVSSSYDVTGRGFYRLDGNILVTKTVNPWVASLTASYGRYAERAVNREFDRYVEPYHRQLGDRSSGSFSISYNFFLGSGGDTLTGSGSLSTLREGDATIDGVRDAGSGFRKDSVGAILAYSGTDSDWSFRLSWNHAVRQDGWGENFPCTDTYVLGVRYVFR